MSNYTPTTEEVREIYRGCLVQTDTNIYSFVDEAQADAEFDRWLAEVKAQEREACVNHVKFLYCSHSMEHKPYRETVDEIVELLTGKENGSEVFDRWLAEVKAQAWEEGLEAKFKLLEGQESVSLDNPYRQVEKIILSNEDYDQLRKALDEE